MSIYEISIIQFRFIPQLQGLNLYLALQSGLGFYKHMAVLRRPDSYN